MSIQQPIFSQTAPDTIVREYAALVRRIARQVQRSASAFHDVEELTQTGMLALVAAARTFVPRGEASFGAYAAVRVRGAMIDALRQSATINRGAMRRRRKLREASEQLTGELGRAPSEAEVAERLGMTLERYRAAVDSAQPVYLEPLDQVYNDTESAFVSAEMNAEEQLEADGLRGALASAITRLPEREAAVLQLYFVEELPLQEIGRTLGIGAARVCQIKKSALEKLRSRLQPLLN